MPVNIFPDLPYDYDALEPYIDKETMELHHKKHHKGYFNKFLKDIENIFLNIEQVPEDIKQNVINNGGGFYNHNFFWQILTPNSPKNFEGNIIKEIENKFESIDKFKEEFTQQALNLFGSGWVWLVLDKENNLKIVQTKNQDNVISLGYKPIINLDLWEHSFYLKYQNRKKEYIDNFWNIINWKQAEYFFNMYKKRK
jgi:Fe-Mn family superoxide dismutase